ncbi:unnamed protein product, partial [Microthlaspi erraticum]
NRTHSHHCLETVSSVLPPLKNTCTSYGSSRHYSSLHTPEARIGHDRNLTVTHNLGNFGGVGLLLTIVTGLFGINVDGISGAKDYSQAFALFSAILFFSGLVLVVAALLYLGLKEPEADENVENRKLELDEMVKKFQREAESHAQVCQKVPQNLERTAKAAEKYVNLYSLVRPDKFGLCL